MKQANLIVFALALMSACIDVFEFDLPDGDLNKLVVNGGVSTLPGPQEIRVFRSRDFDDQRGQSFAVRDAVVYVTDDEGNRFDFRLTSDRLQTSFCVNLEEQLGPNDLDLAQNYRYISDPGFNAQVGRSYTVHVELEDGSKVTSTPQLVRPAIPIGTLEADYVVDETIGQGGSSIPSDRWIVRASLTSSDDMDDPYLTWRHRGTFRITTNPELFCDFRDCSTPGICIPDCCDQCWVVEYGQTVINTDATTVEGIGKNKLAVATIPVEAMRTESVYHLDLYQYRIPAEVYDFFEAINGQLTNQGSIFDPPPHDESSNLTYDDGRDEPILGCFWAAGATHEVLTISPTTVTRQYTFFFPDDCQRVPGASTNKPEYYQN